MAMLLQWYIYTLHPKKKKNCGRSLEIWWGKVNGFLEFEEKLYIYFFWTWELIPKWRHTKFTSGELLMMGIVLWLRPALYLLLPIGHRTPNCFFYDGNIDIIWFLDLHHLIAFRIFHWSSCLVCNFGVKNIYNTFFFIRGKKKDWKRKCPIWLVLLWSD